MRRFVLVVAGLVLLSGCIGLADTSKDDEGPRPAAQSEIHDVEVWDLSGAPSSEAFGVREDRNAGIFETQEPRIIRFEFPGGSELTLEATLVSFYRSGTGEDARFTVGIRTAELNSDELAATFRDVLSQLDVSTDPADQFAAEVRAAPNDQSEDINIGSDSVRLGDLLIGAQAGIAPLAGAGRVIVGGSWQSD